MGKKADLLFALAWAAAALLAAAHVRVELGSAAPEPVPSSTRLGPFAEAVPARAGPSQTPVPPRPRGPYEVGGHRPMDAGQVLRLIQAGELSDREAVEYGGAP